MILWMYFVLIELRILKTALTNCLQTYLYSAATLTCWQVYPRDLEMLTLKNFDAMSYMDYQSWNMRTVLRQPVALLRNVQVHHLLPLSNKRNVGIRMWILERNKECNIWFWRMKSFCVRQRFRIPTSLNVWFRICWLVDFLTSVWTHDENAGTGEGVLLNLAAERYAASKDKSDWIGLRILLNKD